MHNAHGVLTGDKLVAFILSVAFTAAEAGQDEGGFAGDQVATVELSGNVAGECAVRECLASEVGVWRCLQEVAAEGEKDFGVAAVHGEDRFDGVIAMLTRAGDIKLLIESCEEGFWHFLVDADGAIPLDIAVATDRTEASARFADGSEHEVDVGDLTDGGDGVAVLGNAHCPAGDEFALAA